MAEEIKKKFFERLQHDETELQYYGCSSTQFIMDLHEALAELIEVNFNKIRESLMHKLKNRISEDTSEILKSNLGELQSTMLRNAVIVLKQVVEPNIHNYLFIPKSISANDLFTDVCLEERSAQLLKSEIAELEMKYKMTKFFNALCKIELESFASKFVHDKQDVNGLVKQDNERLNKMCIETSAIFGSVVKDVHEILNVKNLNDEVISDHSVHFKIV